MNFLSQLVPGRTEPKLGSEDSKVLTATTVGAESALSEPGLALQKLWDNARQCPC